LNNNYPVVHWSQNR